MRIAFSFIAVTLIAFLVLGQPCHPAGLAQDEGAAGTWQALQKLRTTASVMHTTAHPDDEDGGLLAWLSRGQGARVSLLTLTRGESGDNALGPELFDALGLIRTDELELADRHYGVDSQYYTRMVDYGFSKRLDEALAKWGKDEVLRDVVRAIRQERPLVLVSRFQGNSQDGHGQHQAAGMITREAFRAAGDPKAFPEQRAEGLRPWRPLKLYTGMGFFAPAEGATVRVDTGAYASWLGHSYQDFARIGLSFQRTQNSGSLRLTPGPSYATYRRIVFEGPAPAVERDFFDGIDTKVTGIFKMLGRPEPPGAARHLAAIKKEAEAAVVAFRVDETSACVPALVRGLHATRQARLACRDELDADSILAIKEGQFVEAIRRALGLKFTALAQPADAPEPPARFAIFAPQPTMGPVVPGQKFKLQASLTNRGGVPILVEKMTVLVPKGSSLLIGESKTLMNNQSDVRKLLITVPDTAGLSRVDFRRRSVAENLYTVEDPRFIGRPSPSPPFLAIASCKVGEPAEEVVLEVPVKRLESDAPYGHASRDLEIVPALSVSIFPRRAMVTPASSASGLPIRVEVGSNASGQEEGVLTLEVPEGWRSEPTRTVLRPGKPGEKSTLSFRLIPGTIPPDQSVEVRAVASSGGRTYREGFDVLRHRDLPLRYLDASAICTLRALDVRMPEGLSVGYIMGIGDEVPSAIAQLGARVTLLGEAELASGNLSTFDAIVAGTRAYAVRDDLRRNTSRMLEYVRNGGNLVIFYNTPEFVPAVHAPYPALLPGNSEEVTEEDAPVEILVPDHPALNRPNQIGKADFNGWIEQRGSKFLSSWDQAYTPLIATHDLGQASQTGGWLSARYGKGRYTYFAYALHRQLPFGVPGAYRLLANLLSQGRQE